MRSRVNAAEHMIGLLPAAAVRRVAALRLGRFARADAERFSAPAPRAVLDIAEATEVARARYTDDLCGLLNALTRGELAHVARLLRLPTDTRSPALRAQLWDAGAARERNGVAVSPALQPRPVVLGGHLVIQAPARGLHPPSPRWPRPIPDAVAAAAPLEEPDSLDELLVAADRALGVRLGRRGADKGAWGLRAAALLGVVERGEGEPDWRGDVEIKTVPVARDPSGLWRVVEDPAIAMLHMEAASKLAHTLWLARADVGDGDAALVSWYLLEGDAHVRGLARRYLHLRPKGPAGTDQRGLYMHKRFFADAGLLATLNGTPA